MKKIIHCIFISFMFSVLQVLHAQETALSVLKAAETSYNEAAYTQSFELTQKAIALLNSDNSQLDSLSTAQLYFYKGASEYYLQRFETSIESYNIAIAFCPTSDAGLHYKATLYYERAFSESELGNYTKVYESQKKAALLMETLEKPNYDYLLSIYADIAGNASYLGFIEEANNYLAKAEKIYQTHQQEIPKNNQEADKRILFAYKAVEIINQKKLLTASDILLAKERIQTIANFRRKKALNPVEARMYAVSLNMLGDFYLRKETQTTQDFKSAHTALDKALQTVPREFYEVHYPQFQFNKIKAYKLEKKYDKALSLLNSLLKKLPKNDGRLSFFEAEKANIHLALNDKEAAILSLQKSIVAIHKGETVLKNDYSNFKPSNILNETGLLVEMADIIVKKYPKDPTVLALAANMYKLGLVQFENCYREEIFNDKLTNYYQTAVGGILRLKKLGFGYQNFNLKDLLNTMEMIENRLIWKQFHQNRLLNVASISDSILQKEQSLRKALVAAKQRKDTTAIFEYTQQLEQQLAVLKREFPSIASFAYEKFDIKTVQASMHPSTVIVRYKKIDHELFVFKITKNTIDFYEIEQSEKVIAEVTQYYNSISNQQENKLLANSLYIKLLPFEKNSFTTYTIIPDDILHYIPFETLITSNQQYLIQEATINYATHLVFVNHVTYDNQTKKNDDIIVFTPTYESEVLNTEEVTLRDDNYRLFGAERESKMLASIFPSKLFESILATKDNFIKHSPKAKIIHLAMHANINNETPELSHLLFNENDVDSKMYIEELYGLHLNADLAVLSACNTGKISLDKSQGIVSLNRAFTMAGVPSTLASLWEVPDKVTQGIMVDFYQNLKKGESKTTALRNAKIKYLKNTDDANFQMPFYWAGFVLHGDVTPILLEKDSPNNFICIIAFILLLIIGFIVRSRLKTKTLKLF